MPEEVIRKDRKITPNTVCSNAEFCGGCMYQGISYEKQLEVKNAFVMECLSSENIMPAEFIPISPAPSIYAYRNKMEYSFGDEIKDGPLTLGMHKKKSYMSVVNVDNCQIVPKDFDIVRRAVLKWCISKGYKKRHSRSGEGFLRNLVIRCGQNTDELLITLVTTTQAQLDIDGFLNIFLNEISLEKEIVGVLHAKFDGRADMVSSDSTEILYGRDYYNEILLGYRFKVNAFAFFQTNVWAVETMFKDALSLISEDDSSKEKTIYDLYCGTGVISLSLSSAYGRVVGVDIVEDSINAARDNAIQNDVKNAEFIVGDCLEVLDKLNAQKSDTINNVSNTNNAKNVSPSDSDTVLNGFNEPHYVVVDPPRMGMHPKAIKKIMEYGLDEILYISCNPKTFAQNAGQMAKFGYKVDSLRCYDNFPFTKHVECVGVLVRKAIAVR